MICPHTLALIEEISKQQVSGIGKPSYSFGRKGSLNNLTWLDCHGVPSNTVGIPFGLNNGKLIEVWVGNLDLVQYDISLYWHLGDEISLTLIDTFTVPNTSRVKVFNEADIGIVSLPKDVQIAARITDVPGSAPRNVVVHSQIVGSA